MDSLLSIIIGILIGVAIIILFVKIKGIRKELVPDAEFTYEEAMKYFIAHKDDNPDIKKGALLKEDAGDCLVITQVFLDKDDQTVNDSKGRPLGYKKRVKRLDSELINLFKDQNLVIVE